MDPSVRALSRALRQQQQHAYIEEGTVGEGAFGVVLKARIRDVRDGNPAAGSAQLTAATSGSLAGVSSAAAPAVSSSSSGPNAPTGSLPSSSYVAIKKMLNHREGQGIPQDAYREIKVRQPPESKFL
jgi:hypothetical protein